MNWNGRIAIIGSGGAGSFLAWLLRDSEVRVTLFEQRRLYDKPCGEAVPANVISLIDKDTVSKFIRHKIRVVHLYIKYGGWHHKVADFNKTVGFILDKRKFIMHLRQEAMKGDAVNIKWVSQKPERLLQFFDLVVDARGPYSDFPEYDRILVAQGFKNDTPKSLPFNADLNSIYFWFFETFQGYAWAFPSAHEYGRWDVGIGTPMKKYDLRNLTEKLFGKVSNLKISKIKIVGLKRYKNDRCVRIGEAGGFLIPFTGEGIRPALESAYALSRDIIQRSITLRNLRTLAHIYSRYHRIYRLLRCIGAKGVIQVMLRLNVEDLRNFIYLGTGVSEILRFSQSLLKNFIKIRKI
ncbi:MAG TPA: NAD(P)/FAD-dependent oxidoreductase [Candidatus Bathyarchaeota archaeon]|nr:NAD(P)/FAD-dependent oxidoreductase [Candidatus Bathyarchaeota archaeon]